MAEKKIVIADKMEDVVVNGLKNAGKVVYMPANLNAELADADALVVRSKTKVTEELLSHASPRLKVVARAGVAIDNIDVDACEKRGIKVMNTPGSSTNAVAELVIGLMITCARSIHVAHHSMQHGKWLKNDLVGSELNGKVLGVLGYGRIGRRVAQIAQAFGMSVIASDPMLKPGAVADHGAKVVDFETLLADSDYITLHVPHTKQTDKLLSHDAFSKMKCDVVIVNTSRGAVVDGGALLKALDEGKVKACALDVHEIEPYTGPLSDHAKVVLTPHVGASTKEAQGKIGAELLQLLTKELSG
ncbi:MAG: hydroxyacid dehydrogenase [Candidatus Micrarchaeia archaeon]|jgi:D-3-phosphoglycerate dehydrogenase